MDEEKIYAIQRTQGGAVKVAYRRLSDAALHMNWVNKRAGRRSVRIVPVTLK
ncbi:hypothetical protein [Anaeroselena agilis]|uniref:Uncharacterized protein n=1 Tax=Anaeroselena agilis TaxID=3063788 RepID=A0ABU3NUX3_9FIRM|nr:hypothetical protein [Selenomonadales bacterium 4137-cl]